MTVICWSCLLHRQGGVKEGHCGTAELETFLAYLGRQGYKLILVDCVFCYNLLRQRGRLFQSHLPGKT